MKRLISSRNIKVVLAVVLAITCINGIGLNLNDYPIQVPDGTSSSQSKTTSTSSIPDYTGLASVVLSDGSGLDISDLPSETVLSELDSLGRCGTVEMVVTPDTMPAAGERRGSIGMVKPSGWHTVRDDSLDGKYLYNGSVYKPAKVPAVKKFSEDNERIYFTAVLANLPKERYKND